MTHDELVEVGRRWCLRPYYNSDGCGHGACSLVLTEMISGAREQPDVIGWTGSFSILLEAKASRSDFKADGKKFFRKMPYMGLGKQRFYIAPKGLLSVEELPEGWGLIEVSDKGKTRVKRNSFVFEARDREEIKMLLSLIRRLKVDPGRHIAIKAYVMDTTTDPKATVTLSSGDASVAEGVTDEG